MWSSGVASDRHPDLPLSTITSAMGKVLVLEEAQIVCRMSEVIWSVNERFSIVVSGFCVVSLASLILASLSRIHCKNFATTQCC